RRSSRFPRSHGVVQVRTCRHDPPRNRSTHGRFRRRTGRMSLQTRFWPAEWSQERPISRPERRSGEAAEALDREEVAGAGVARRVAQLRHRTRLDLADALTREVEVLADLFERAGL